MRSLLAPGDRRALRLGRPAARPLGRRPEPLRHPRSDDLGDEVEGGKRAEENGEVAIVAASSEVQDAESLGLLALNPCLKEVPRPTCRACRRPGRSVGAPPRARSGSGGASGGRRRRTASSRSARCQAIRGPKGRDPQPARWAARRGAYFWLGERGRVVREPVGTRGRSVAVGDICRWERPATRVPSACPRSRAVADGHGADRRGAGLQVSAAAHPESASGRP